MTVSQYLFFAGALLGLLVYRIFRCPNDLRHLPRAPLLPLLSSYLRGESEDIRIRTILLPMLYTHGHTVIVVWVLGSWYIHALDHKLVREVMEDKSVLKQKPNEEMMFWRFLGSNSIFFADGEQWKKHSSIIRTILQRNVSIEIFCDLSKTLLTILGPGGTFSWSDLSHRLTLDAVGLIVMGYHFQALTNPHSPIINLYHSVMEDVSNPLYAVFPILERLLPRREVSNRIEALIGLFWDILQKKKSNPGSDLLTFLIKDPEMTDAESRDSIVTLFMAGHDTTAGAISTLLYYLAIFPEHQNRVRAEIRSVIGDDDPTIADFERMPFLWACIKEAMRINSPSTVTIPRLSPQTLTLGPYTIPPGYPIVSNIYGVLHNNMTWESPFLFQPSRFLNNEGDDGRWMVFGTGPRRCPARNMALYEMRTVFAFLLRDYKFHLAPGSIHEHQIKNRPSTFALNLPYDLYVEFEKLA